MVVTYEFLIDDGNTFSFTVDTQRQYDKVKATQTGTAWTELTYHQCENCPLHASEFLHCPVAIDVREIAERFADIVSHQKITSNC